MCYLKGNLFLSNIDKKLTIEVVILAGGQSRRMGQDKTRLRVGRRTLLGHARRVAEQLDLPCRVIKEDCQSGFGPIGGIQTALRRTNAQRVLFLCCDMPFLSSALVEKLLALEGAALFTEADGMAGFPFCLTPGLLPAVERRLESGELSLQKFARDCGQILRVPKSNWPQLTNINTPEQLATARARLQ
ncbi:MAG: molybdenum cofactor guanylyltransferase [Verrucomicrobiota bacterium]|nr:molybdenum cofactor guanylyltransferase [Verrucomicrobiota bacterium]